MTVTLSLLLTTIPLMGLIPTTGATDVPEGGTGFWWQTSGLDTDGNRIDDRLDAHVRDATLAGDPGRPTHIIVDYDHLPTEADESALRLAGGMDIVRMKNLEVATAVMPASAIEAFVRDTPAVGLVEFSQTLYSTLNVASATVKAKPSTAFSPNTVWERGYRGEGMVIGVIDTGVRDSHTYFRALSNGQPKWIAGADFVGTDRLCMNPADNDGHGTHVAATALGNGGTNTYPYGANAGTAPEAQLVELKISDDGTASTTDIIASIDWAISWNRNLELGTAPCPGITAAQRIDVLTLSFGSLGNGGNGRSSGDEAVNRANAAGIAFTVAAGNCGPGTNLGCPSPFNGASRTIGSPATADGAITVANSDDRNTVARSDDIIASTSSRGPRDSDSDSDTFDEQKPEIAAPGSNIVAASHTSDTGTATMSGTSMATPLVAGVSALLLQANPKCAPYEKAPRSGTNLWNNRLENPLRDALIRTAETKTTDGTITQTGKFGRTWSNAWGYGLLDANAALTEVLSGTSCPTGPVPLSANAGGPYSAQVNQGFGLSGSATGGTSPYAFAWDLDGNGVYDDAAGATPTVSFATAGTRTIALRVSDNGGATATATATVTIEALPPPPPPPTTSGWPQFHRDPALTASTPETAAFGSSPTLLRTGELGAPTTGAVWGDVDGDGKAELVVGLSARSSTAMAMLAVYKVGTGSALEHKWTVTLPRDVASHTSAYVMTPALVASGDASPGLDILVTWNYVSEAGVSLHDGNLALYDGATGASRQKVDIGVMTPGGHPIVANLDADAASEVVVLSTSVVSVYEVSGGRLTLQHQTTLASTLYGAPVVADLDGDGKKEVVVTAYTSNSAGSVSILSASGTVLRAVTLTTGPMGAAAADLDGDGILEIVVAARLDSTTINSLLVLDTTGGIGGYTVAAGARAGYLWGTPSLGDVDGDGRVDIVVVNANSFIDDADRAGDLRVYGYSGGALALKGHVARLGDLSRDRTSPGGAALADLDRDGRLDIVFGSRDGTVLAYRMGATGPVLSWTWTVGSPVEAPPMITDVTGNGEADIVVGAASGRLIVLGSPNVVPVIDPIADQAGAEGSLMGFAVRATDGNGDRITLVLEGAPASATFADHGDGTGSFSWTPGYDAAGTYRLVLVASDGKASDRKAFVLVVAETNRAPVLQALGDQTLAEGATLGLSLTASDPDGDAVTLALGPLPEGATFVDHGDGTGSFSWTPGYDAAGTYTLEAVASDGVLAARSGFVITVSDTNRVPVLQAVGDRTVAEGGSVAFTVTATDPDGDALALAMGPLPRGATFVDQGDGTGRFSWSPDFAAAGTYALTARASDGAFAVESAFVLTVTNTNRAPTVQPILDVTSLDSRLIQVTVRASDADGDRLSLSVGPLPQGATFTDHGDGTGTFSWTPAFGQAGTYALVATASDGSLSGSAGFTVTVQDSKKLIQATVTGYKCTVGGWAFALTDVTPENAPGSIQVTWSNGQQDVLLLKVKDGKARYETTAHLTSKVTSATAYIDLGWSGKFALSEGPCV